MLIPFLDIYDGKLGFALFLENHFDALGSQFSFQMYNARQNFPMDPFQLIEIRAFQEKMSGPDLKDVVIDLLS
jgi:hypothetical protein